MDVVAMTRELISFDSASQRSNLEITDYLERALRAPEFEVERLEYRDDHGVPKASLVAKKGTGAGGLALLSHSDTVPAEGWDQDPFQAVIRDGCLSGRGSCDMNRAFDPPTNGWNMIIDNGNTPANVTAARSMCTISFRPMPGDPSDEIIEMVREKAVKYGLEFAASKRDPFVTPRDSAVVAAALTATKRSEPETVAFGTDAFAEKLEMVILGPGDIRQAHTVGEWISVPQLQQAVEIYARMIPRFCGENGG